jgi:hypothetical protein
MRAIRRVIQNILKFNALAISRRCQSGICVVIEMNWMCRARGLSVKAANT